MEAPEIPELQHKAVFSTSESDLDLSIAERCSRGEEHALPRQYHDNLPQMHTLGIFLFYLALNSLWFYDNHDQATILSRLITNNTEETSMPLRPLTLQWFKTPPNLLGLFRRFYGMEWPSHDPEEHVIFQDLCDLPAMNTSSTDHLSGSAPFYPYFNKSSLALGEWFWNQGT